MERFYKSLPGYCTFGETFYPWLAQRVPLDSPRIVELGCAYGQSAACLAVELINRGCVDPKIDLVDTGPESNVTANLAPVAHVIGKYWQELSWDASAHYEDGSLDAVFIDAGHSKECVLKDIAAWRTKVQVGGILAGHDFAPWPGLGGVIDAVIESFDKWHVMRCEKFTDQLYYPCWLVRIGENGQEID